MVECSSTATLQRWEDRALNASHSRLVSSATGRCITGAADAHSLTLQPCEPDPQGPNFGFQLWMKIAIGLGPAPPPAPPSPPSPPPSPPPPGPALPIHIDGQAQYLEYDGIGLLSAGGSSRYLYDYPQTQRDQILDYLFKPNFGASLDIIKVEIGGDCQSTSGTEASHMHTRDDLGCSRGYEGWLLSEATKRNPMIKTFGLSWGVPGWVGEGEFFSADNIHYQVQWVECMQTAYNISIDLIGIWNERQYGPMDYTIKLREALDAAGHTQTKIVLPDGYVSENLVQQLISNQTFSDAVYALGTHSCSAAPTWHGDSTSFSQKWWCTELEVHNGWGGGASWAEYLSTNFVKSNQTSTTSWSLIWSTPTALTPYQNCGAMMAHEPWSGHYTVDAAIWMHAHWTQFTEIGWKMLTVESGSSGFLPDGSGTYVTIVSPDGNDFSIVIERLANTTSMRYNLHLESLNTSRALILWKTSESSYFQRDVTQALKPVDGVVTIEIAGECIYTLSTVSTAVHGNFSVSPVPQSGNFSLPYADGFDSANANEALPKYFADQGGSFAVLNGTLSQRAPMPPGKNGWVSTFDYRDDPITMIGDLSWNNVSLAVRSKFEGAESRHSTDPSVKLRSDQYVQICGRVSSYQGYAKGNYLNSGVCLRLNSSSLSWELLERAQINSQEGYQVLRTGSISGKQLSWHNLSLELLGSRATASIDGMQLTAGVTVKATHGLAMLGSSYHQVHFDDFLVRKARAETPAACINNTDLPGADLDARPHSNMSACAASCQSNEACVAWIFGSCGGYNMCYRKRVTGAPVSKACVCSAAIPGRRPQPPSPVPPTPPSPPPPPSPAPPLRPLAPAAYRPVKLGSIQVQNAGWMGRQLGSQHNGLSGHQQIGGGVHAAVAAWINGTGYDGFAEAWPYWLNGYIPLAALRNGTSEGQQMVSAIRGMLDTVFALADERDGWLGPLVDGGRPHDPWSVYRFLTCLTQWWDLTADTRVAPAMFRFAVRYQEFLELHPLNRPPPQTFLGGQKNSFSHVRAEECVLAYQWLLDCHSHGASRAALDTVNTLLWTLRRQGFDWINWINSTQSKPFVTGCGFPRCEYFPTTTESADLMAGGTQGQWVHGVNTAQGLSHYAARYRATGDRQWLDSGLAGWQKVYRYHGQASGVFSADEHLAGLEPQRGTETCAVVETLNSLTVLFLTSGEVWYADQAELVALNALPAAFFNGSMWALNYHQQANKLDAVDSSWGQSGDDTEWWSPGIPRAGTCTGSQPGAGCTYCFGAPYECCLSNHGQGFPKFAARALATAADGSLLVLHYFALSAPQLRMSDGNIVSIEMNTMYPFEGNVEINVTATRAFTVRLRVPGWLASQPGSDTANASISCAGARTRGLASMRSGIHSLALRSGHCHVVLRLPMRVRIERRAPYRLSASVSVDTNTAAVYRGPLLFSIPRSYALDLGTPYGTDKAQARNHVLLGEGDWRFAIELNDDMVPEADLRYATAAVGPMMPGQGIFAETLVPSRIHARAILLPDSVWLPVQPPANASHLPNLRPAPPGVGRGAPFTCINHNVSQLNGSDYTCIWTGHPPRSPVSDFGVTAVQVTMLPFGATDLRISELPTFVAS